MEPTLPPPATTRGTTFEASVEGESITTDPTVAAVGEVRLPSTGADGTTTMAIVGGGLVLAGGLLLTARRRIPALVERN